MLAKMETYQERMESHHKRVMTKMYSQLEKTEACLQKTETTEEIESKSEHQEVPKKEAAVKTIKAMENQYGDHYHSEGGFQKKFPLLGSRFLILQRLDTTTEELCFLVSYVVWAKML
jgi:hypothetical protein